MPEPVAVSSTLPGVLTITRKAFAVVWSNRRLFAGITLVYAALSLLLVRGLSAGMNVNDLRQLLTGDGSGLLGSLAGGLTVFALIVADSGNASSDVASLYQSMLIIITSLAIIWALRQVLARNRTGSVRVRDAFYKGMYPLIPVLLVLLVILLQLLPLLIGASIYTLVVGNGIAATAIEQLLWLGLFLCLAMLSLYLLASSVLALYIATLPDMTPLRALRSAGQLVRGRRWAVLRKLLFLPLALVLVLAVVMVPVILFVTPLAAWLFALVSFAVLPLIHAYLYTLYLQLLPE